MVNNDEYITVELHDAIENAIAEVLDSFGIEEGFDLFWAVRIDNKEDSILTGIKGAQLFHCMGEVLKSIEIQDDA